MLVPRCQLAGHVEGCPYEAVKELIEGKDREIQELRDAVSELVVGHGRRQAVKQAGWSGGMTWPPLALKPAAIFRARDSHSDSLIHLFPLRNRLIPVPVLVAVK